MAFNQHVSFRRDQDQDSDIKMHVLEILVAHCGLFLRYISEIIFKLCLSICIILFLRTSQSFCLDNTKLRSNYSLIRMRTNWNGLYLSD